MAMLRLAMRRRPIDNAEGMRSPLLHCYHGMISPRCPELGSRRPKHWWKCFRRLPPDPRPLCSKVKGLQEQLGKAQCLTMYDPQRDLTSSCQPVVIGDITSFPARHLRKDQASRGNSAHLLNRERGHRTLADVEAEPTAVGAKSAAHREAGLCVSGAAGGDVGGGLLLPSFTEKRRYSAKRWHGCPRHAPRPKHNRAFWEAKLAWSQGRDRVVTRKLKKVGWTVLRTWECALANKHSSTTIRGIEWALGVKPSCCERGCGLKMANSPLRKSSFSCNARAC